MFSLQERPTKYKVIRKRWAFKKETINEGIISRHKARFVANGYPQIPGVDFGNTDGFVALGSTLRKVLALEANRGYVIYMSKMVDAKAPTIVRC